VPLEGGGGDQAGHRLILDGCSYRTRSIDADLDRDLAASTRFGVYLSPEIVLGNERKRERNRSFHRGLNLGSTSLRQVFFNENVARSNNGDRVFLENNWKWSAVNREDETKSPSLSLSLRLPAVSHMFAMAQ